VNCVEGKVTDFDGENRCVGKECTLCPVFLNIFIDVHMGYICGGRYYAITLRKKTIPGLLFENDLAYK
jgi:hypothetical protein